MKNKALNFTSIISILTLGLYITACSSSDNSTAQSLNVSLQDRPNAFSSGLITYATIQSTSSENITINGITVNRGNCPLLRFRPVTLRYGQSTEVPLQNCTTKDVLEVTVDTDKGSESYSFN